jgi:hypothetical protein
MRQSEAYAQKQQSLESLRNKEIQSEVRIHSPHTPIKTFSRGSMFHNISYKHNIDFSDGLEG